MKLSFPSYSGSHNSQRSHNKTLRIVKESVSQKTTASLNTLKHLATFRSSSDHKALLDQITSRKPGKHSTIEGLNLTEAILPGLDLSNSDIRGVNFTDADLAHLNAKKSNWFEVSSLAGANLSGANLSEAKLSHINLSGANLSGANLSWADLIGANLSGANLSGANLSGANLSGAKLDRVDFSRANLDGAKMLGSLPKTINWEGSNLEGIITTDGDYVEGLLDPKSTLHKAINPPAMIISNQSYLILIHTLLKTYPLYRENLGKQINALYFLSRMTFNNKEVIEYVRKLILPDLYKLKKLILAPKHAESRLAIIDCIKYLEENTQTKEAAAHLAQRINEKIKPQI